MDAYVPITCIEHERLEIAVLKRQTLSLTYLNESGVRQTRIILPTDVTTRSGAEWLSYRDAEGTDGIVRLDRIVETQICKK